MLDEDETHEALCTAENLAIAIEIPCLPLDHHFFEAWIRSAEKLQAIWLILCEDKGFAHQVERLRVCSEPHFGMAAIDILSKVGTISRLRGSMTKICLAGELAEELTIMISAGLFRRGEGNYQIAIPGRLDIETVRIACLALAATEDAAYMLHPEALLSAVPLHPAIRRSH